MNKSTLLALSFLVFFACKSTDRLANDSKLTDDKLTEKTVSLPTIKGHIYFLASDELRGRDMPSSELNIAGRYLATSLMRYGVKPAQSSGSYFQPMPMKKTTPPTEGTLTFGADQLKIVDDFVLLEGTNTETTAEILFLNQGSPEKFEAADMKNKIVVTGAGYEGQDNPQEWFFAAAEKREIAKKKGAKALIELFNSRQIPWDLLVGFLHVPQSSIAQSPNEQTLPHLWMNTAKTDAIAKLKATSGQQSTLSIKGLIEEKIETFNVVGMVEGTDPVLKNEYIIYSAHYDHVGVGSPDAKGDTIYNGARDNATGSVTVLSAAENLAKYPTKRSAIFIFFTGEEKGLLGSNYYANNPIIPLDKVVYCFNSDNAGYNDTTVATIIGLTRTDAQPLIEKACLRFGLKAVEDAAPEQGLFDRSDNVNFAKKGVPAPTFSLGFTSFDDKINKYYHQPGDEPATLDYDYLNKFFKSYVYACRLIGNANQSVFWKKGDKYFEAGQKLYGSKVKN